MNNPRYVILTQEQELFIKEKRNEGLSYPKISKALFETFGINIKSGVIFKRLNVKTI